MGNLDIPKNKNNTNMSDKLRAINKKKKFVADGVFHAELHEFFGRILADYGYGGMEVRSSEARTDITVRVVTKDDTSKDFQRKHNELTSLIQKRYGFEDNHVNIKFDPIRNKGLCASAQAEMLKTKLLKGIAVRTAALSIINTVMKFGEAIGCEVIVSGKMRVQRAKCMKYKSGYCISTGQPKKDFVDTAVRHCFFKQGIIGVKVKIMIPHDPQGKKGTKLMLPDTVRIEPPKDTEEPDILPPTYVAGTLPPQGEQQ